MRALTTIFVLLVSACVVWAALQFFPAAPDASVDTEGLDEIFAELDQADTRDLEARAAPAGFGRTADEGESWSEGGEDDAREAVQRARVAAEARPALVVRGVTRDRDERAVEGAQIEAWWRAVGGGRSRRSPPRAESNADGAFELRVACAGEVELEILVRARGHAPRLLRREHLVRNGPLDLGDVVLDPGTRAIGSVVDPRGNPVEGATLRYHVLDAGLARVAARIGSATSDARGRFEFADLPATRFAIEASLPEHVPAISRALDASPRVDVGALVLVPGVVVRGRVFDARHRGVEACDIHVLFDATRQDESASDAGATRPAKQRSRFPAQRTLRAKTAPDGSYHVAGLPSKITRITVRHPDYYPAHRAPVVVKDGDEHVDFELAALPRLRGVVVDWSTGRPIESFALRLRRVAPEKAPSKRAKQDAKKKREAAALAKQRAKAQRQRRRPRSPEAQRKADERAAKLRAREERRAALRNAADARREAAQRKRAHFLTQHFGPSKTRPKWLPRPSAHPGGRFDLPAAIGHYVVDVGADDYVAVADGPHVIDANTGPELRIQIRLTRGSTLSGELVARDDKKAIARARIDLLARMPDRPAPPTDPLVAAMHPPSDGLVIASTRSNGRGKFRFGAQRPGTYVLRARADGFDGALVENVVLQRGRAREGVRIALARAASLRGRVLGARAEQKWRVLVASTSGFRKAFPVDARGEYRADGLRAGTYYARAFSPERAWGPLRLAFEALALPGRDRPEILLRSGDERRLDLDARQDGFAALHGTIRWNGAPAKGLQLELHPVTEPQLPAGAPRRRRALQNFLSASTRTRTDREGAFRFDPVLPGAYVLEAHARVGRARQRIGRLRVRAQRGARPPLRAQFETGELEILVRGSDGKPRSPLVLLALASETRGKKPRAWRALPSLRTARVARDGRLRLEALPIGEYEWLAYGGGLASKRGTVRVARGTQQQRIALEARRPRSTPRKK